MHKKIETGANIAIIILAGLLSIVLARGLYLRWSKSPSAPPSNIVAGTPISVVGKSVSLAGVDWSKNGKTLVLGLQKGCHFCTESADFYRRLRDEQAKFNGVRFVAVLPQSVDEASAYLLGLGVSVDLVKQSPLDDIGVEGTPTLLLVNDKGVITDSWIGKLRAERETEVLAKLESLNTRK